MPEIDDRVSAIVDQGNGTSMVYYNGDEHFFPVGNDIISESGLTQGAVLSFGPFDGQGQTIYYEGQWLTTII
jgi:hypothetical protein